MGENGIYDLPKHLPRGCGVLVDDVSHELVPLVSRAIPSKVWYLSKSTHEVEPSWQQLDLVGVGTVPVGIYVRVNEAAKNHRHHGFGFTNYLLVLSDGASGGEMPPDAVRWLTSAFPWRDVIVIDAGVASAWKGRSLRGTAAVETRMDLWRLLAHADLCIDLAPGHFIARECAEALRFGTPIIVPSDCGPAVVHARGSGGSTFSGPPEILAAVEALQPPYARGAASAAAQAYAESRYAHPDSFVASVRTVMLGR
jgi:hypothetical protein